MNEALNQHTKRTTADCRTLGGTMICFTKLAKEVEIDAEAIERADVVLVKLPSGKLVTKIEYLATRETTRANAVRVGAHVETANASRAVPGATRNLTNDEAFVRKAERLSKEKGLPILKAATILLGTWAGAAAAPALPARPSPAPSSTDEFIRGAHDRNVRRMAASKIFEREAAAFAANPGLVPEAQKLALLEGLSFRDAAKRILRLHELDQQIATAKKGA